MTNSQGLDVVGQVTKVWMNHRVLSRKSAGRVADQKFGQQVPAL